MSPLLWAAVAAGLAAVARAKVPAMECEKTKSQGPKLPNVLLFATEKDSDFTFSGSFFQADVNGSSVELLPYKEVRKGDLRAVAIGPRRFVYRKVAKDFQLAFVVEEEERNCSAVAPNGTFPLFFNPTLVRSFFKSKTLAMESLLDLLNVEAAMDRSFLEDSFLPQAFVGKRWLGCSAAEKDKPVLSMEISVADKVRVPDPTVAAEDKVPLAFRFRSSGPDPTKMDSAFGFLISGYASYVNASDEALLRPPFGVQCPGPKEPKTAPQLPALPAQFAAQLRASNASMALESRLVYSTADALVAFDFAGLASESLLPFTERLGSADNMSAVLKSGHFRVVLDGRSGLYHSFVEDGQCLASQNISTNLVGLVESVPEKKGMVQLRNASDLLTYFPASAFVYQGQVTDDRGEVRDFFTAVKANSSHGGAISAVSVFVTVAGHNQEGKWYSGKGPAIVEVRYYAQPKGQAQVETSRVEVVGLSDLSSQHVPLSELSVLPCLRLDRNSSFVYAKLTLGEEAILNFGEERLKSGLREWLAGVAGISPLRLESFYVRGVGKDAALLLARIGDAWPSANAEHLVSYRPQPALAAALDKINASLATGTDLFNAGGTKVHVAGAPDSLRLVGDALGGGGIPPAPKVVTGGYSGGSMAVLALAMLLIGGAAGFGGAFFMWKRHRGIAYQVYE